MAVHGAGDIDQLHRTDLHRVDQDGQGEQFAVQSESAGRGGDGRGVVAVAAMTRAPPRFCSSVATSLAVESI